MTCDLDSRPIDIHGLLARFRQIAEIWSVDDVHSIRPDLSAEQAWQVLLSVQRDHNAEIGISWDVLDSAADCLFGPEPDATDLEEAL